MQNHDAMEDEELSSSHSIDRDDDENKNIARKENVGEENEIELNEIDLNDHSDHRHARNESFPPSQNAIENSSAMNMMTKETPIPWAQLVIVFFIYLVDSLSLTSIFAYIGFMVADFNIVGMLFHSWNDIAKNLYLHH